MSDDIYEGMKNDCQNGVRNLFETDIDCGGTFCPAAILSGSCLGGKNCIKDSDCLSGVCDKNKCTQSTGYNSDGIFTATVATFSLLSSTHDTNPMPEISVTNEIGLTTEMCSDSDCLIGGLNNVFNLILKYVELTVLLNQLMALTMETLPDH